MLAAERGMGVWGPCAKSKSSLKKKCSPMADAKDYPKKPVVIILTSVGVEIKWF